MPFFQLLGYDVFNPLEFKPEFTADVGIKKGEKVDYAIYLNDQLCILIEAKGVNDNLSSHGGQLFRYFSTTKARFGILTNGTIYKFYTDLDVSNKMDEKPFLEFDLLNIKENLVPELKKFTRVAFDEEIIYNTASELKYSYEIKKYIEQQLKDPADEFAIHIIKTFYESRVTQPVVEKFKPLIKKTINQYISELMNDKISNALKIEKEENNDPEPDASKEEDSEEPENGIETTEEEIEALYIVKGILSEIIQPSRLSIKDTMNYCSIILDEKVTRWVCRVRFSERKKTIIFPGKDGDDRTEISSVEDIYKHKTKIAEIAKLLDN